MAPLIQDLCHVRKKMNTQKPQRKNTYANLCSLALLKLILSTPLFLINSYLLEEKGELRSTENVTHDHRDHVYSQQIKQLSSSRFQKNSIYSSWIQHKLGQVPSQIFGLFSAIQGAGKRQVPTQCTYSKDTDLKKEPDHIHKNSMECKISKPKFTCTDRSPQKVPYLTGPLACKKKMNTQKQQQ